MNTKPLAGTRRVRCALALAFAVGTLAGCGDDSFPNRVTTDKGVVEGVETTAARQFLGIPYAAPPVGVLRWKAPQEPAAWSGVRDAKAFAGHCAQSAAPAGSGDPWVRPGSSEDCLYLNVFVPKGNGPFPVMVWIHGGALLYGASDDYLPDALVSQGVAVVTLNYRLGPLGFLTHPALSQEAGGASGNYGLMDQQAALKWVRTNIAAFGGDPANVTLFGESAGGQSTLSQIASPTAAGLFHKAIVQSGAYNLAQPTLAQAETLGKTFATNVGCTDQTAACLRALPVATVNAKAADIMVAGSTSPTVDGKLLTANLGSAFASGSFNKVPVIQGSNQHEFSSLSGFGLQRTQGAEVSASQYPLIINATFQALAPAVLAAYPADSAVTPQWTYDNVVTDAVFACNGRKISKLIASQGPSVYAYEFADANAPVIVDLPARPAGYGAYHFADIAYVFPGKQWKIWAGAPFTASQAELSNRMVGFWAQFAKTGNPNAAGSSAWPAYTSANDTYLTLAPGAVATSTAFSANHKCSGFWTPGV